MKRAVLTAELCIGSRIAGATMFLRSTGSDQYDQCEDGQCDKEFIFHIQADI